MHVRNYVVREQARLHAPLFFRQTDSHSCCSRLVSSRHREASEEGTLGERGSCLLPETRWVEAETTLRGKLKLQFKISSMFPGRPAQSQPYTHGTVPRPFVFNRLNGAPRQLLLAAWKPELAELTRTAGSDTVGPGSSQGGPGS